MAAIWLVNLAEEEVVDDVWLKAVLEVGAGGLGDGAGRGGDADDTTGGVCSTQAAWLWLTKGWLLVELFGDGNGGNENAGDVWGTLILACWN